MALYKNELREIFRRQTYGEKRVLTWKGVRRIKLFDKTAALHDIWDAFCREFDEQRRFLEDELARMRQDIQLSRDEQHDSELLEAAPGYVFEELRVLFRELGKVLVDPDPKAREILDRIQAVLETRVEHQQRIVDETERDSRQQMDRLRRRLERMAKDLQLSEEEVKRLRKELAAAYDGGVASIYNSVQGLSPDEPEAEKKRDLLGKLFASNVELRRSMKNASADSPSQTSP